MLLCIVPASSQTLVGYSAASCICLSPQVNLHLSSLLRLSQRQLPSCSICWEEYTPARLHHVVSLAPLDNMQKPRSPIQVGIVALGIPSF